MTLASAIGLTRFDMARGKRYDRHTHAKHQLAWASSGVLMVDVEDHYWVLPTALALWIPADVRHTSMALKESVMQGIYLDPASCPRSWSSPTVLAVSALGRHLIEYLTGQLDLDARVRAETVLLDVLHPVEKAAIELPSPRDERARDVADILLADPTDRRSIEALARQVGSSPRTLLRLFVADTGLTFNQWRTHARLQSAMARLADGEPVAHVAGRVGYATASAFVAAFHRVTGHTPAAYFATGGASNHHAPPTLR